MNRNKIISTLLTCSIFSNNVSALENIKNLNSDDLTLEDNIVNESFENISNDIVSENENIDNDKKTKNPNDSLDLDNIDNET